MKYQKAIVEVIRFNENEEFMALSGNIGGKITTAIQNAGCGVFSWTSPYEEFTCSGFKHKTFSVEIEGITYTYATNENGVGHSRVYNCNVY